MKAEFFAKLSLRLDFYPHLETYILQIGRQISLEEMEKKADLYSVVPRGILKRERCKWYFMENETSLGMIYTAVAPYMLFLFMDLRQEPNLTELEIEAQDILEERDMKIPGVIYDDWQENPPGMGNPSPAMQWLMWTLYTASMFMNPPLELEFVDETTGFHHGQRDGRLHVFSPECKDSNVGYVDYSEYPYRSMDVHVNFLFVHPRFRRRGIGRRLVQEMLARYQVDWGLTTAEGFALLTAVGQPVMGRIGPKPNPRRPKKEMERLRKLALSLIKANPTLSIATVARHFGVSEPTVSKWFAKAGLRRWS